MKTLIAVLVTLVILTIGPRAVAHAPKPPPAHPVEIEWRTPREILISCNLALATSIPYVPRERHRLEIEGAAGTIYGSEGRLPDDLLSGIYLYENFRDRELGLVPRYNITSYITTKLGVHTHQAIEATKVAISGSPIDDLVVGAGEGMMAFGEFWEINNKAGRRPDATPSLDLSVLSIIGHGGLINDSTRRTYMDRSNPLHAGHMPKDVDYDEWQLRQMELVFTQSEGARLVRLIDRLGRVLRPYIDLAWDPEIAPRLGLRIPKEERKGGVRDIDQFLMTLLRGDRALMTAASPLQYIFTSTTSTDGMYHGILNHWGNLANGADAGMNLKFVIPKIIEYILVKLAPVWAQNDIHLAELHDLALQFGRLPERGENKLLFEKIESLKNPNLYCIKKPAPDHR